MKKYGSLFFVAAMVISSVAHADIPIVHRDHESKGTDLQKEMDTKCKAGEPRVVTCGALGVGCSVKCGVVNPGGPEASTTTKATRKTAAVKNTDSAE